MKTRIFAAVLAVLAAGGPLYAFAEDAPVTSTSPRADTGKTTLNCQWSPGNEDKGGNWGCADKDHAKNN